MRVQQAVAKPAPAAAVTCKIVEHVVQKLSGSVWFLVQIEDVLGQRVSCRKSSIKISFQKNYFQKRPQGHILRFVDDKQK